LGQQISSWDKVVPSGAHEGKQAFRHFSPIAAKSVTRQANAQRPMHLVPDSPLADATLPRKNPR
jgi:hypothetical protein